MSSDKIKIPTDLLDLGMYVAELDKPWIESPFIFQGFLITNDDELDQLHQHCEYVFVDRDKSQISIPQALIEQGQQIKATPDYSDQGSVPYQVTFEEEFPRAKLGYEEIQSQLKGLFRDVRFGRVMKTAEVQKHVQRITESILRNPDAMMLMSNLKAVDEYLVVHAMNVCIMTIVFARFLGFEPDEMQELGMGALLHDIGEIRLPQEILNKHGELSPEEYATIQKHTAYGVSILKQADNISDTVLDIVLHHHERVNRSGYPEKLSGQEISKSAKIVGLVDVYDSLTSPTSYRGYMSNNEALKSMYDWRGTLFDETLVEMFIKCLGVYPIGSTLELNSGEIGIVISTSPQSRLLPTLMLVRDAWNKVYDPPKIINLSQFREDDENLYEIRNIVRPEDYDVDLKRYILREVQHL